MWANTIYELADPYNATINVCVKLCHVLEPQRLQLLPITGGWRAVNVLCMTEEPYLQTLPAHTIKSYPNITTEKGLRVGGPQGPSHGGGHK